MSVHNYIRPSKNDHKTIAVYLETEFFSYLDNLNTNEFDSDDEKEFIKRLIKIISKSFGRSQEAISTKLDKGDHAVISHGTKRINRFLKDFCSKKISPPIQLFFYHINSIGEKKRPQCHLACSEGKIIPTVKGSERIYSYNISSFEYAKISCEQNTAETDKDFKSSEYSAAKNIKDATNNVLALLKNQQVAEAKKILSRLDPLDPKVIFYKQLAKLIYKPIRKFSNNEAKKICKNLEVLLKTKVGFLATILLYDIYEKYNRRLGRKFDIDLPDKPSVDEVKHLPEYDLVNLIITYR